MKVLNFTVQAARVREVNPDWSDEDIFQAARRRVIASLQAIIVYEYLPSFLGTSLRRRHLRAPREASAFWAQPCNCNV